MTRTDSTTPTELRGDAGLAAAQLVVELRRNPREFSTPEDCAAGLAVLARTVLGLTA